MGEGLFTADLFGFLKDLKKHNDRAWFAKNKERYQDSLQEPALEFVRAVGPALGKISKEFVADDRPVGGSLFRIYRDIRFSKDKTPYKTHVGIHFRHRIGKDVHAPGYYLHLEPGQVFVAAGIWHPDREPLAKLRQVIVDKPKEWTKATQDPKFAARYRMEGEQLKRAPAGIDPDHPFVEDLKRKDYVASAMLDERTATREDFVQVFAQTCAVATPFMRFLCRALDQPF